MFRISLLPSVELVIDVIVAELSKNVTGPFAGKLGPLFLPCRA